MSHTKEVMGELLHIIAHQESVIYSVAPSPVVSSPFRTNTKGCNTRYEIMKRKTTTPPPAGISGVRLTGYDLNPESKTPLLLLQK
jgi:hypothetical protein